MKEDSNRNSSTSQVDSLIIDLEKALNDFSEASEMLDGKVQKLLAMYVTLAFPAFGFGLYNFEKLNFFSKGALIGLAVPLFAATYYFLETLAPSTAAKGVRPPLESRKKLEAFLELTKHAYASRFNRADMLRQCCLVSQKQNDKKANALSKAQLNLLLCFPVACLSGTIIGILDRRHLVWIDDIVLLSLTSIASATLVIIAVWFIRHNKAR